MVVETEFCSPLKVMARAGNTAFGDASPHVGHRVMFFRTLTKNSPIRATARMSGYWSYHSPGVSALVTETELANGFGNRFVWVAAHRSNVSRRRWMPGMADLVHRLHSALSFAQTAGQ